MITCGPTICTHLFRNGSHSGSRGLRNYHEHQHYLSSTGAYTTTAGLRSIRAFSNYCTAPSSSSSSPRPSYVAFNPWFRSNATLCRNASDNVKKPSGVKIAPPLTHMRKIGGISRHFATFTPSEQATAAVAAADYKEFSTEKNKYVPGSDGSDSIRKSSSSDRMTNDQTPPLMQRIEVDDDNNNNNNNNNNDKINNKKYTSVFEANMPIYDHNNMMTSSNLKEYCASLSQLQSRDATADLSLNHVQIKLLTILNSHNRQMTGIELQDLLRSLLELKCSWKDLNVSLRQSILRHMKGMAAISGSELIMILKILANIGLKANIDVLEISDSSVVVSNLINALNINSFSSNLKARDNFLLDLLDIIGHNKICTTWSTLDSNSKTKLLNIFEDALIKSNQLLTAKQFNLTTNLMSFIGFSRGSWQEIPPSFKHFFLNVPVRIPPDLQSEKAVRLFFNYIIGISRSGCSWIEVPLETRKVICDWITYHIIPHNGVLQTAKFMYYLCLMACDENIVDFGPIVSKLRGIGDDGSEVGLLSATIAFALDEIRKKYEKSCGNFEGHKLDELSNLGIFVAFVRASPHGKELTKLVGFDHFFDNAGITNQLKNIYVLNATQSKLTSELKTRLDMLNSNCKAIEEYVVPTLEFYPIDICILKDDAPLVFIEIDGIEHYNPKMGKAIQPLKSKYRLRDRILQNLYPNVQIMRIQQLDMKRVGIKKLANQIIEAIPLKLTI